MPTKTPKPQPKAKGQSPKPEASAGLRAPGSGLTPPQQSSFERELESDLHLMYDESGSAKMDMTRLDITRHSTLKKILIGMTVFFAVLAAIAWAGVLFFSPSAGPFSGDGVSVDVEGPTEVKSGEVVTYAVHYKNGERVALGTASLELRLPKEFKMQSSDPVENGGTWQIGSIAPGHDGLITVKGIVLAPMDKELDVQAVLTYRPADFNSEFQKVSTKGMKISGSVLDLQVSGPPKVLPGDHVTLTYAYKNNSESPFEHLRVRAQYPSNFIPESSTPPATGSDLTEWDIPTLDPGKDGTVTVLGSFASDAEGNVDLKGQIGFMDDNGTFALQQESTFTTDVIKGDLVTSLILNGKSDGQPIKFGDMLRYAITYKNTGTAVLGNVSLKANFETLPAANVLDWNKLTDKAKGIQDGNSITWTKKQIPSLARVGPGDGGTLDFEIPFLDKPISGVKDGDFEVSALVEATIDTIDETTVGRVAKTAPVVAKAVSDASLVVTARYFNDDGIPIGSGPLPPKVGEKTTYRIIMKIANTLHDMNDLRMTAKLPPNVIFTGISSVDAGDLRFDAANDKMVWTLNWMPTNIPSLTVSFDAAITPSADQQGKFPTLIDGIIFEATDKQNGFPMLLSASPLTTSLDSDPNAAGKGRVE